MRFKPVAASWVTERNLRRLTPRGRERAGSIIRRHRLAERLFTDSLAMAASSEIEQQACKFEHILSLEATRQDLCFLGHPTDVPADAPESRRGVLWKKPGVLPQTRSSSVRQPKASLISSTQRNILAIRTNATCPRCYHRNGVLLDHDQTASHRLAVIRFRLWRADRT